MLAVKMRFDLLVLVATCLPMTAVAGNVVFPFGKQYNTNTAIVNTTNIYVDMGPVQAGLDHIAQAMQEDVSESYRQGIKKRYPELVALGSAIGLDPDLAESTLFLRQYGKAAYEKEIETRLTELQENLVVAADIARAVRGEEPIADDKTLLRKKESSYPFRMPGLLALIGHVRHHGGSVHLYVTDPLPRQFDPSSLFDEKAPALSDAEKALLARALAAKLLHRVPGLCLYEKGLHSYFSDDDGSCQSDPFHGVDYGTVYKKKDLAAIVADAQAWHAAVGSDFNDGSPLVCYATVRASDWLLHYSPAEKKRRVCEDAQREVDSAMSTLRGASVGAARPTSEAVSPAPQVSDLESKVVPPLEQPREMRNFSGPAAAAI